MRASYRVLADGGDRELASASSVVHGLPVTLRTMLLFTWIPTLLGLATAGGFVYFIAYPAAVLAAIAGASVSLVVAACYGLARLLQALTSLHLITLAGATRSGQIDIADIVDADDQWDGLTIDAQEG